MRSLGFKVEQTVKLYLLKNKLRFVDENFSSRFGEIDLIMLDENTLCFIEVRHRKNAFYGSAAESITPTKQKKIRKTALFFLQKNTKFKNSNCRFDVVLSQGGQDETEFEWIKDAF